MNLFSFVGTIQARQLYQFKCLFMYHTVIYAKREQEVLDEIKVCLTTNKNRQKIRIERRCRRRRLLQIVKLHFYK